MKNSLLHNTHPMPKNFLILTLLGTIAYFLIGWLIFDAALGSYTEAHTTQLPGFKKDAESFNIPMLILSCMAYAVLITFILTVIGKVTSPAQAFLFSAVVGVLIAIMTDFYWYASSNFYSNSLVVFLDIAGAALSVGILGATVVFISNKLNTTK